jgi:hypothetical protein
VTRSAMVCSVRGSSLRPRTSQAPALLARAVSALRRMPSGSRRAKPRADNLQALADLGLNGRRGDVAVRGRPRPYCVPPPGTGAYPAHSIPARAGLEPSPSRGTKGPTTAMPSRGRSRHRGRCGAAPVPLRTARPHLPGGRRGEVGSQPAQKSGIDQPGCARALVGVGPPLGPSRGPLVGPTIGPHTGPQSRSF